MLSPAPRASNLFHYAVEVDQLFGGHGFGSFQQPARAVVGAAHFAFLVVGQRHDPQGQYLVDLGSVEQIASALGRDLWIVVKNDWRRKDATASAFVANQHGIRPRVYALQSGGFIRLRRIEKRNKRALVRFEDRVGRNKRIQQRLVARSVDRIREEREVADDY